MKGLFSAIVGIVAGAAWSSAAPSGIRFQPRAVDDLATRTRVKLHPAQIRLLADSDYEVWSIADDPANEFSANGLDFTLSAGDAVLEGDWNKVIYREHVPMLGERLVGTAVTTHEDSAGGPVTLTIAGLPEGEHSLLTWHNSWQSMDEFATVSVSVNGEEAASVSSQRMTIPMREGWKADNRTTGHRAGRTYQQHVGGSHVLRDLLSVWLGPRRNHLHPQRR